MIPPSKTIILVDKLSLSMIPLERMTTPSLNEAAKGRKQAYMRAWRKKNREAVLQSKRRYYQRNRDKCIAKMRERKINMPFADKQRQLQYTRDYYEKNKERVKKYQRDHQKDPIVKAASKIRQRRRYYAGKKLLASQKAKPCMDCSIQYHPYLMEFDHVPERGAKAFNLSDASYKTAEDLLLEISKCDVVCANCHRKRTLRRRGVDPEQLDG